MHAYKSIVCYKSNKCFICRFKPNQSCGAFQTKTTSCVISYFITWLKYFTNATKVVDTASMSMNFFLNLMVPEWNEFLWRWVLQSKSISYELWSLVLLLKKLTWCVFISKDRALVMKVSTVIVFHLIFILYLFHVSEGGSSLGRQGKKVQETCHVTHTYLFTYLL